MIVKCIAILAIVARINVYADQEVLLGDSKYSKQTVALAGSGSGSGSGFRTAVSGGITSGTATLPLRVTKGLILPLSKGATLPLPVSRVGSNGVTTKNAVAKGKYPVVLRNCGLNLDKQIPVTISHIQAPVREKIFRLPAQISAPRLIAHTCTCTKNINRPCVIDQINVPTIKRYIETINKPVVENIHCKSSPVYCNEYSRGPAQLINVRSDSSSSSDQYVVVPQVSTYSVPQIQFPKNEVPPISIRQIPQIQSVGLYRLNAAARTRT